MKTLDTERYEEAVMRSMSSYVRKSGIEPVGVNITSDGDSKLSHAVQNVARVNFSRMQRVFDYLRNKIILMHFRLKPLRPCNYVVDINKQKCKQKLLLFTG